ncbi:MAG: class I SAM-dependent methyltransferase [Solirubrobacteraceae bacterium]
MADDRFFPSVLRQGSLGFGEAYMAGWWDADDLEEVAFRLLQARLHWLSWALPPSLLRLGPAAFVNQQTRAKSSELADRHYDLGNDLFFGFLGRYKSYSCGYFDRTTSLDTAQVQKLELLCRLLNLNRRDHLLDVGGGWGEFAHYAATHYGCHVTSINISDEQIRYARELCQGLPVDVVKCDYRDLAGSYDKIAVIAMLTHVGHSNYRRFMAILDSCLGAGGRVLIETLGSRISKVNCERWTNKYIFPGGLVPSLRQLDRAREGYFTRSFLGQWGDHYIPTLRRWNVNLQASWGELSPKYPDTTRRMLEYFFLTVAAAFRAGHLKYWHILLDKHTLG